MIQNLEVIKDQKSILHTKEKKQFDANIETKKYFNKLLELSKQKFSDDIILRLQNLRTDSEDKVYTRLQQSKNNYLHILIKQRNEKIQKIGNFISQKLILKQNDVISDLKKRSLIIDNKPKSIETIKKELQQKILLLKTKSPKDHITQEQILAQKLKEQKKYENYLQFRSPSYWKNPNQKNVSVIKFLQKMKIQKKKLKQRVQILHSRSKAKQRESQSKAKIERQQRLKIQKMNHHKQYNKQKSQRQNSQALQILKKKQIEEFLDRYKKQLPIHIRYSQRQKMEQQAQQKRIKKILAQNRDKKKQYSLGDINQSLQRYNQYKEKHAQENQEKRLIELQQQQNIKLRLNRMYKSKIRALSAQKQIKPPNDKQIKHDKAMKIILYSQKIKQKYKPKIDEQKRLQLIKSIEDEQKVQNKIKKIKNGQLILIDKFNLNPRQIGLKYLQQVKQITSLIQRKKPDSPPSKEIKIIDRALLKNTFYNKSITISNWKQIIQNQNLSFQQKQTKLNDYIKLVDEQKEKIAKYRKNSSLQRSIQLQKKSDHYQIQKATAKLALLKNLI